MIGISPVDCLVCSASPVKPAVISGGRWRSWMAWSIAASALSIGTSGALLKPMVIAGNCPWWLSASGASPSPLRVTAESGTALPPGR